MKFDAMMPRALVRWLPRIAAVFGEKPGDAPPAAGEAAWADGLFFGAVPLERWNPDELLARHGGRIYRRMLEDDQIKALVAFKRAAVLSRPWTFELPRNTPEHRRCEAFFRFILGQVLRGTFGQALDAMMTSQVTGFSVMEKVLDRVQWEGREWWGITAIKLRPASSFSFIVDAHGNLAGMTQRQASREVPLPPDRFIRHVNKPEVHAHYGESDLKECHRHWWAKENILKFWNIYLERMAAGFLHGRIAGPLTPSEHDDLKRALKNINARTSIITPASVELEMVTAPSTDAFERAVAARDRAMARALLVPNLLGFSEPGQTGSFSQSRVHLEGFLYVVNALADSLADTLNEQMFRDLARWNFGLADPPRFVFDPLSDTQKRELARAWSDAVASGAVKQGAGDERRTRELLSYPTPEAA